MAYLENFPYRGIFDKRSSPRWGRTVLTKGMVMAGKYTPLENYLRGLPKSQREIMLRFAGQPTIRVEIAITPEEILNLQEIVRNIYIDDSLMDYIVDLVCATRDPGKFGLNLKGMVQYGASPRGTIYLNLAARAHAFLQGRGYVMPQDVKSVAHDVLRHRVILSYEAEAEDMTTDHVIDRILDTLEVP